MAEPVYECWTLYSLTTMLDCLSFKKKKKFVKYYLARENILKLKISILSQIVGCIYT